jgi:predicted Fe-Mo cluster-binding NifX family protein
MRVALTVWENRISPVADSSRKLLVADIENRAIEGRYYEVFNEESVLYRARKLADLEVEVFICGAISDFYARLVEGYGIRLISFIHGEADEVLGAYLKKSLPNQRFVMAGYLEE